MNLETAVVHGTIKDDGTLELDEKPPLAPGRVQVTILAIPAPVADQSHRTLLDTLDDIHASQKARGYRGRSIEEMERDEAQRRAEEDDYETRWNAIWAQTSTIRPPGETAG